MQPTNNENSVGPVIAIVIVLVMIILGGFYFWGERSREMDSASQTIITEDNVDEATSAIESQSTSDESLSIEEDLMDTEVDSLDAGLENI